MKKIISVFLLLVILCSLCACSKQVSATVEQPPTEQETIVKETEPITIKAYYESNGIKISYIKEDYQLFNQDHFYFTVENNSKYDILFSPSNIIINNASINAYVSPVPVLSGQSETVIARIDCADRMPIYTDPEQIQSVYVSGHIIENPGGKSEVYKRAIDDNVYFGFSKPGYNPNENILLCGEKMYENEEIVLYVDQNVDPNDDYNYFDYTIINKTNKIIYIEFNCEELVLVDFPNVVTTETLLGTNKYIAGNNYVVDQFYFYNTRRFDISKAKVSIIGLETTNIRDYISSYNNPPVLACNNASFALNPILPKQ